MLLFPSCHRWNIHAKRKCHVIFLSSSFLLSFIQPQWGETWEWRKDKRKEEEERKIT